MTQALIRGDSYQRICRDMAKRFEGQSVSNVMRVVQTEGTHVARQAQAAEMRAEGFEEYHLDPVGDDRTCDRCREAARESRRRPFRFDEAETGTNFPPLHPRCRCMVNPAVEDWSAWLRKRREERREASDGTGDETIAKRFGGDARERFELRSIGSPVDWYKGSTIGEVEEAKVFDADGNPIEGFEFKGSKGSVTIEFPEGMDRSRLRVCHTHPRGGTLSTRYVGDDGRESGDINLVVKSGVLGEDALTDEYVYRIERADGARPDEFLEAAERAESEFRSNAVEEALDEWYFEHRRPPMGDDLADIDASARAKVSERLEAWYQANASSYG